MVPYGHPLCRHVFIIDYNEVSQVFWGFCAPITLVGVGGATRGAALEWMMGLGAVNMSGGVIMMWLIDAGSASASLMYTREKSRISQVCT